MLFYRLNYTCYNIRSECYTCYTTHITPHVLQYTYFSLPVELGDMLRLQDLLLSNNSIRLLPYELGRLFQLNRLELDGNPLTPELLQKVHTAARNPSLPPYCYIRAGKASTCACCVCSLTTIIDLLVISYYLHTVIIAKVREVRENIKRNRLIWRIIQLWCFHHYHIVISHNTK